MIVAEIYIYNRLDASFFMVRFKNRYLLCEISFRDDEIIDGLSGYAVQAAIIENLAELYGNAAALLGPITVKYYSCFTNLGIPLQFSEFSHYSCQS